MTRQSPYMDVFHGHRVVRITIDSGATGNMIRHSTAKHLGCPIISCAQSVQRADGSSQLQVVGEMRTSFTRDNTDFTFEGLVVEDLDVEVLAGTPFMEENDVARCYLAMAPPTHTVPRPLPALPQPSAEPLFSVLLPPPRLFGPENSWKYSSPTMPPLIQSMHLNAALMHLVYVISSPLSCGRNQVSFPVLCGQSAYQTCQPNLERLSVTNTSARSPPSSNKQRS
ncbi:unnamed protein product, partial [Porites evermanni]